MSGAEMSGAETARRRVFQRRNGGAEMSLPLISVYIFLIQVILNRYIFFFKEYFMV